MATFFFVVQVHSGMSTVTTRRLVAVAMIVVMYYMAQKAFGHEVTESFTPHSKDMDDLHEVLTSLNEHEYALSYNMKEFIDVLKRALCQWGYELVSVGDSLHYSLSNITIRHVATRRFYTFKSVTFLPNPLNGFEIHKVLFEV